MLKKEDESSLARWDLCIHELASIVTEYECEEQGDEDNLHEPHHHHEHTVAFKNVSPMMPIVLRRL